MCSFMQRQFIPYAILCRLGGCFYIQNFRKPLENAKVTWKTLYTAYSTLIVSFFFAFEISSIIKISFVFRDLPRAFTASLMLLLRFMLCFKILVNTATMATGSSRLLEFFKKSSTYETISGFSPASRGARGLWRHRWSFFCRSLVVLGVISTYVMLTMYFTVSLMKLLPANLRFLGIPSGVLFGVNYIVYDALPYMVLRSCSAVLVDYLQAQVESFESCCKSQYVRCDRQLLRQLEVIRYNLGVIRDLKNSLNAIWHVPLAAMSAGLILLVCVVWYAIFYEGLFAPQVPLSASYCLYSSFAFIDMACVSQALTDQAQKLKNDTKIAFTFEVTDGYTQQLRYLHETIDPDGMCLSGGGFFRLNKSLLVSMAGTMITYTVIISQTSDDLTNHATPTN
ncbi:unnamed protein product [Ixodes persulcatus]